MGRPATDVPDWASNTNWSALAYPTKLTPSAGELADGHVANSTFKAEYANYITHWVRNWAEWSQDEMRNLFDQATTRGNTELRSYLEQTSGAHYGDGDDGDVTISGSTTLTSDVYYDNLTVGASGVLYAASYRIFVRGTLTVETGGVIHCDGGDGGDGAGIGTGGTAGAAAAAGSVLGSSAGGVGGSAGGNGIGGVSPSGTIKVGGDGGDGAAGANTGGAGGTTGASFSTIYGGVRHPPANSGYIISCRGTPGPLPMVPGGGGGGGGGGTISNGGGGGGGGGGGILCIAAYEIQNSGTIRANGGAGGDPGGSGAGAGGGGGGGVVLCTYRHANSALGTIEAVGGAAGTGGTGTPTAGAAGPYGVLYYRL